MTDIDENIGLLLDNGKIKYNSRVPSLTSTDSFETTSSDTYDYGWNIVSLSIDSTDLILRSTKRFQSLYSESSSKFNVHNDDFGTIGGKRYGSSILGSFNGIINRIWFTDSVYTDAQFDSTFSFTLNSACQMVFCDYYLNMFTDITSQDIDKNIWSKLIHRLNKSKILNTNSLQLTADGIVMKPNKKFTSYYLNIGNDYNYGFELWYNGTIANDGTIFYNLKSDTFNTVLLSVSRLGDDIITTNSLFSYTFTNIISGYDPTNWLQLYFGFGPIDNSNTNFEICMLAWQSPSYSNKE